MSDPMSVVLFAAGCLLVVVSLAVGALAVARMCGRHWPAMPPEADRVDLSESEVRRFDEMVRHWHD